MAPTFPPDPSLVRPLTATQAARLAAGRPRQTIRSGRILLYRDHIPYVGYLILEGRVGFELGRGTRLARFVALAGPLLIGEFHVANRRGFPMTVRVLDAVVACTVGPGPGPGTRPARGVPAPA